MESALHHMIEQVRAAALANSTAYPWRRQQDFHGPQPQGERLDTRDWHGVVSHEPTELVVTVRAARRWPNWKRSWPRKTSACPSSPHFGPGATVGGMVAAGLSGPARASVGAVRDYVLGLQLINGRAEHLVFGGQVMKNVAGYDLSRLMVGAWGTLG